MQTPETRKSMIVKEFLESQWWVLLEQKSEVKVSQAGLFAQKEKKNYKSWTFMTAAQVYYFFLNQEYTISSFPHNDR